MQIRPQEAFPILYQLSDPYDTATYYVRSVVRNSANGAVLVINGASFFNLTRDPNNSRRFSKLIEAPSDPSGTGFWIDVTSTVYTDAAYTQKSQTYQETCEKYLLAERWNVQFSGGGGWGNWEERIKSAFDYTKLAEVVIKSFNDLPTTDLPNYEISLSQLLDNHDELKSIVSGIKIPEPQKIDLQAHTNAILSQVAQYIREIKFPEQKEVYFQPVMDRLDKIKFPDTVSPEKHAKFVDDVRTEIQSLKDMMPHQKYSSLMDDIASRIVSKNPAPEDPMEARLSRLTKS